MAPAHTQLLLLSGSVANPHHVVQWLQRLGRRAQLVRHDVRPVPLKRCSPPISAPTCPRKSAARGPESAPRRSPKTSDRSSLFALRRASAEALARDLARQLPNPQPLTLTGSPAPPVGEDLARMLKARVAYHHSGLSYAARAGVVEPLAKAGQLRAVVATMGLAAGINFSLRSVAVTASSYRRDGMETPIREGRNSPDVWPGGTARTRRKRIRPGRPQ